MATHSSILAWKIPGMEKPVGLPSWGPQRVRHDWVTEYIITDRIWVVYSLGLTTNTAMNVMFIFYECMGGFLLDKYIWTELLSHGVCVGLAIAVTGE